MLKLVYLQYVDQTNASKTMLKPILTGQTHRSSRFCCEHRYCEHVQARSDVEWVAFSSRDQWNGNKNTSNISKG